MVLAADAHDSAIWLAPSWQDIHSVLCTTWRDASGSSVLPEAFPVSKLYLHTEHSLSERKKALKLYLRGVVASVSDDAPPDALLEFLGLLVKSSEGDSGRAGIYYAAIENAVGAPTMANVHEPAAPPAATDAAGAAVPTSTDDLAQPPQAAADDGIPENAGMGDAEGVCEGDSKRGDGAGSTSSVGDQGGARHADHMDEDESIGAPPLRSDALTSVF